MLQVTLSTRYFQSKSPKGIKKKKAPKYYLRRFSHFFKICLIAILVCGILGFLYVLAFNSSYFKVETIRVLGAKSYVNSTDLEEIVKGKVHGRSIFSVNSSDLRANLLENFKGAKDIKVHKVYPQTVSVEVTERKPLALVYNDSSTDYYLVDPEGYVLGQVDKERTNFPQIHYEGDIQVGFFVDQKLIPVYLELMDAVNSEKVSVSSVSFSNKSARIFVNGGTEVLIGNDKNKFEAVKIMNSLLKQLVLEGKKVDKIDLRFDKVIVSYE